MLSYAAGFSYQVPIEEKAEHEEKDEKEVKVWFD